MIHMKRTGSQVFPSLAQLNFIKRMNMDLTGYSDIKNSSFLFTLLWCASASTSLWKVSQTPTILTHAALSKFLPVKKAAIYSLPKISEYSVQAKLLRFLGPQFFLWQLVQATLPGGMEQEQPGQELRNAEPKDNSKISCNTHPSNLLDLRCIRELATKCSLLGKRIKEASKGFRPGRGIMPSINKEVSTSACRQRQAASKIHSFLFSIGF